MSIKKKKYRHFKPGGTVVKELSGVDKPAQEGARMVLMKRDDSAGEAVIDPQATTFEKARLTDAIDGHTHIVDDTADWGNTTYNAEHSHPWVRTDGAVIIGETDGHTHIVVEMTTTKSSPSAGSPPARPDETQPGETDMSKTEGAARIEALEAQVATFKALAALSDAQKSHYAKLDDSEQASFLAKSAAERDEIIEKSDPVVYTTDDGIAIRKSDGSLAMSLAKKADENTKLAKKHEAAAEHAVLAKRADDELGNITGTPAGKIALLKSMQSMTEEDAAEVARILKAVNDASAGLFKSVGHTGVTADGAGAESAEGKLESLAKKLASEKGISFAKAYDEVTQTAEGQKLYAEALN